MVLFIGNSYTAANSLPSLTASLALSAGDSLFYEQHTPGGNTLQNHSFNSTALGLIASQNWDHVVLQGQSQETSLPMGQVQSQTFPYAVSLCESIRDNYPCTRPMFYMTWGRENGDSGNCALWPPVCTYEGMDDLIRERYEMMADDNEAYLSPVGVLWRYIRDNHPEIDLYSDDGSHPSIRGSYAAACSFYSVIFEADPLNISDNSTLNTQIAQTIRDAAHEAVYLELDSWNIGDYAPVAMFSHAIDDLTVQFTDLSSNGVEVYWNFGDGNTSEQASPTHHFASPGDYLVTQVVSNCGIIDSIEIELNIVSTGVYGYEQNELTIFYPNPTSGTLYFKNHEELSSLKVYDLDQKLVFSVGSMNTNILQIPELKPGIYSIEVIDGQGKSFYRPLVKE